MGQNALLIFQDEIALISVLKMEPRFGLSTIQNTDEKWFHRFTAIVSKSMNSH
jgi:hypothetical protein